LPYIIGVVGFNERFDRIRTDVVGAGMRIGVHHGENETCEFDGVIFSPYCYSDGLSVAPAQAPWIATPYLGVNSAGDVETGKGGPGGSIGYVGDRLGFEVDFQLFKHFFKDADVADLVPSGVDLDTDARSFMGNVVTLIRIPGATNFRPYGAAGIGVIRAVFETSYDLADTDQNNLAFNVGGGILYSLNDRVSLRGDVRYMRALVDEDKYEGGFFRD
jgi:opacity protein-like surface antigen